eukprot:11426621-Ditylum_brightwellii.AAC.1
MSSENSTASPSGVKQGKPREEAERETAVEGSPPSMRTTSKAGQLPLLYTRTESSSQRRKKRDSRRVLQDIYHVTLQG